MGLEAWAINFGQISAIFRHMINEYVLGNGLGSMETYQKGLSGTYVDWLKQLTKTRVARTTFSLENIEQGHNSQVWWAYSKNTSRNDWKWQIIDCNSPQSDSDTITNEFESILDVNNLGVCMQENSAMVKTKSAIISIVVLTKHFTSLI